MRWRSVIALFLVGLILGSSPALANLGSNQMTSTTNILHGIVTNGGATLTSASNELFGGSSPGQLLTSTSFNILNQWPVQFVPITYPASAGPSLTLTPATPASGQAVSGSAGGSLALVATISQVLMTVTQGASLALSPTIAEVAALAQSATLGLSPAVAQALAHAESSTLSLLSGVSAALAHAVSSSFSLAPAASAVPASTSIGSLGLTPSAQSASGLASSASLVLSPVLSIGATLSADLSSALSLSPSLTFDLVSTSAAALSLTPTMSTGLSGIAQSVSLALSPAVSAVLSFFETVSASISLSSSIANAAAFVQSPAMGLVASVDQDLAGISQSASLTLSPVLTVAAALSAALDSSLSLGASFGDTLAATQPVALSLLPAVGSVFSATLGATLALVGTVNEDLSAAQSSTLGLVATLAADIGTAQSSSIGLASGVTEDLGALQAVSLDITPSLTTLLSFFESFSASLSLTPSLSQDAASIQTESLALLASTTQAAEAAQSGSLALLSTLGNDLGSAQSLSVGLTPALGTLLQFFATAAATISLLPSVDEDVAGLSQSASLALSSSLSNDLDSVQAAGLTLVPDFTLALSGVAESISLSLTPTLESMLSFFESLSADLSLSSSADGSAASTESVAFTLGASMDHAASLALGAGLTLLSEFGQDIGTTQSASATLSAGLSTLMAFVEPVEAALSLLPNVNEDLGGLTQSLGIGLSSSADQAAATAQSAGLSLDSTLGQDLAGISQAVSVSLTPLIVAVESLEESLTASISMTPGLNQELATAQSGGLGLVGALAQDVSGVAMDLTESLLPSMSEDLGGIAESAALALAPDLTTLRSFIESLDASLSAVPSLNQDLGGVQSASLSLASELALGLSGVTEDASVSMTAVLGQDLAGISQDVSVDLSPLLTVIISFVVSISATLALNPAVQQDLSGIAQTGSLSLESLIATDLPGVTQDASMTLSSALALDLAGVTQGLSVTLSPLLGSFISFYESLASSLSLSPGLQNDLGLPQQVALSLASAIGNDVAGVTQVASIELSSGLSQDLSGIAQSVSLALSPLVSAIATAGASLTASLSLTPALEQDVGAAQSTSLGLVAATFQDLGGLEQDGSLSLSAAIDVMATLSADLSPTLSLLPSLSQDLGGVAQSASVNLLPSLSGIAALSETLLADVNVIPGLSQDLGSVEQGATLTLGSSVGQDIAGIAQSSAVSLTPTLGAMSAMVATLTADVSILPSVMQDIAGLTQDGSVSLLPSVNQDLGGLIQSSTLTLASSLAALSSMAESFAVALTLAPTLQQDLGGIAQIASVGLLASLGQDIGGLVQSASVSLLSVVNAVATMGASLSASVSLLPGVQQDLRAVAQDASLSLASMVGQDLGGVSQSASIAISTLVNATWSMAATLSASLSLSPSIQQDLSNLQSSTVGLLPSIGQDLGGVVQSASLSLVSSLTSLIGFSFNEAVSAGISLAPSVGQDIGGVEQDAALSLESILSYEYQGIDTFEAALSASVSLVPSVGQDIDGVIQSATVSLNPSLAFAQFLSFIESVMGLTQLAPALNVFVAASESVALALSPALKATLTTVTLSPVQAPSGVLATLSGSGYSPLTTYNYCLETTTSSPTACSSSSSQLVSTASGAIPANTMLQISGSVGQVVVVVSHASAIAAYATFNIVAPAIYPVPGTPPTLTVTTPSALACSPSPCGPTGTPVTLVGTGFSPNAQITLSMSGVGYVIGTVTTNSTGGFSTTLNVPAAPAGTDTIVAMGGDISTVTGDTASSSFTLSNTASSLPPQVTVISLNPGSNYTVFQTSTIVQVTIFVPSGSSAGNFIVTTVGLTQTSYGVNSATGTTVAYYDIHVTGTIPTGATAKVCITNSAVVNSGSVLQYWSGTAWVTPAGTFSLSGSTVCLSGIPLTALEGTNFAIVTAGGGTTTTTTTTTATTSTTTSSTTTTVVVVTTGTQVNLVTQPIKVIAGTPGSAVVLSVSGCDTSVDTIVTSGGTYNVTAAQNCILTINIANPQNTPTNRFEFTGGSSSTTILTCSSGTCAVAKLTYFQQTLQTLSYAVSGEGGSYTPPTLSALQFGATYTAALTKTPTLYWLDAVGKASIQAILGGSNTNTRWAYDSGLPVALDATVSHSLVLTYMKQYNITVSALPSSLGMVTPSGSAWYNYSATLKLTAYPVAGTSFSKWSSTTGFTTFSNATAPATTAQIAGPDTVVAVFGNLVADRLSLTAGTKGISPGSVFTISGCDAAPSTLTAGSRNVTILVTPDCGPTITAPPPSLSGYRIVFSNGQTSFQLPECGPDGCQLILLSYYLQAEVVASYSVVGPTAPSAPAPLLNFTGLGAPSQLALGQTNSTAWMDYESSWSIPLGLPGSSSTERWETSVGNGTAAPLLFIDPAYFHQYLVPASFEVIGGGVVSGPTLEYSSLGTSRSAILSAISQSLWIDARSTYLVQQVLTGSSVNARWATQTPSGTVDFGLMQEGLTPEYYSQYNLAVSYSIKGGGTGYDIPIFTYTAFGALETVPAPSQGTVWADSGTPWLISSQLTSQTSGEGWTAMEATSGTVISALTISIQYMHSFLVAIAQAGLPAGTQWSVSLDGYNYVTQGSQVAMSVPVGTHIFNVTSSVILANSTAAFVPILTSGVLQVSHPLTLTITFTDLIPAIVTVGQTSASRVLIDKTAQVIANRTGDQASVALSWQVVTGTRVLEIDVPAGAFKVPLPGAVRVLVDGQFAQEAASVEQVLDVTKKTPLFLLSEVPSGYELLVKLPPGTSHSVILQVAQSSAPSSALGYIEGLFAGFIAHMQELLGSIAASLRGLPTAILPGLQHAAPGLASLLQAMPLWAVAVAALIALAAAIYIRLRGRRYWS